MTIFWPAFIGGIVCVVIGIVILVYRSRLADTNANAQRAVFGKTGDRVAQNSTSGRMGMTGAGIVIVGLVGIVLSLLNLNW
ncbi:hypothetical protein AB0N71_16555 [Pseudarthrobacter enclensis]|uniref:hypothetical protein n=1 Tax=Pseudarthrobacter enclensis TaxID=993070 RepID=UPI0034191EDB